MEIISSCIGLDDGQELQAVLDAATVGIVVIHQGRCRQANLRAAELLGYEPGGLNGLAEAELFPVTTHSYPATHLLQRRDGSSFWARLSFRFLPSRQGDGRCIWIIEDISQERAVEEALQKTMQELYGILNTAVVGIALLRHRKIDRCNTRMEELFRYGPGEMFGCSTRVWYASEEVYQQVGQDVYADWARGFPGSGIHAPGWLPLLGAAGGPCPGPG